MIVEVVHTSAPNGLAGRHGGFTVVAATRGVSEALVDAIAAGSAYTFAAPGATPPTVWSLRRLRTGAGAWNVLTRIVECGLDHTGRRNRIAHHVAVDEVSRRHAGPEAWIRSHPFRSAWTTAPRELDPPGIPGGSEDGRFDGDATLGDRRWIEAISRRLDMLRNSCVTVVLPPGVAAASVAAAILAERGGGPAWSTAFSTRWERNAAGDGVDLRLLSEEDPTWPREAIRPGPLTIDLRDRPTCPQPAPAAAGPARVAAAASTDPPTSGAPRATSPPRSVASEAEPATITAEAPGIVEYVDRRHGARIALLTFLAAAAAGVALAAGLEFSGILGSDS